MTPRRLIATAAVLAAVPALSACGNKEKVVKFADTEGVYVDVGELKYQVQLSRQLNPSIPEDRTFLSGLSAQAGRIAPTQEWFAVFVRLQNDTHRAHPSARSYVLSDTTGRRYTPLPLAAVNPFRYVAGPVAAGAIAPNSNSIAAQTSINGMELLYKVPRSTMDNKPLVLTITSPTDRRDRARVDIDV